MTEAEKQFVLFHVPGPTEAEQRAPQHPEWKMLHPHMSYEQLGFLSMFLNNDDPRSAKEQFGSHQPGGWHSFKSKWELRAGNGMHYPGDETIYPLAMCKLRDEVIHFYPGAFVRIMQPDGTWDMARLD